MTRVTRYLEVNSLELSCSGCFQPHSSFLVHLSYCIVLILLVMWSMLRLSLLQCLPVDSFLETRCLLGSGPGDSSFPHGLSPGSTLTPDHSDPLARHDHADYCVGLSLSPCLCHAATQSMVLTGKLKQHSKNLSCCLRTS